MLKNHAKNEYRKLVPDPFLILVNNSKQPLHPISSFKIAYFERVLSKSFKKVNFNFFFFESIPY